MTEQFEESNHALRVLIFDDEQDTHEAARQQVARLDCPIQLIPARTAFEASEILDQRYIDFALIDLYGPDGSLAGIELLRYLSSIGHHADVALMTHLDVDVRQTGLLSAIAASSQPHVVNFIDKRSSRSFVAEALEDSCSRLKASDLKIENLEFLVQLVDSRRRGYERGAGRPLRDSPEEIAVELDRLCRQLFAERPDGARTTRITVSLEPLERLGLSAAVAVKAVVSLGMAGVTTTSSHECVLKVGPRDEIAEEASRYIEFVRFGVRLEERVELLSYATGDVLGAVVYSMAGGTQGSLTSLDELFEDDVDKSASVIARLFANTSWYHTPVESGVPRDYFADTYRVDLVAAFDQMVRVLNKTLPRVGGELREGSSAGEPTTIVEPGGKLLELPNRAFTGSGPLLQERPWCLVHGDMHGGNVMVELLAESDHDVPVLGRINLIDYRQSGPGPRCIDSAALECAIRMSHAQSLRHAPDIDDEAKMRQALRCSTDEELLYRSILQPESIDELPTSSWSKLSATVIESTFSAFAKDPVEPDEYLITCLLYGQRQFRYPLDRIARIRIAAWLSGLYAAYKNRNGAEDA